MSIAAEVFEQSAKALIKGGRKAATTTVKKTTQAVAKEVAPTVPIRGIEYQISKGMPRIKATKWGKELSDIQLTAIERNFRKGETMDLQPEIEDTVRLLDQPEMTDEATQFLDNTRGFADADMKAEQQIAARDATLGREPAADPESNFTVDPNYRAKSLENLDQEQISWQWENVENIWKDIDSRIMKGKAAAAKKNKEFKPGDDLVSLQASLGPINPNQVKGWVKSSMAKMKSGLSREVGGTVLNEKGIPVPEVEGMSYLELHHELMKKLYASYTMKARELYEAGIISKVDVLNFNHLANERGFGMGDYGVKGYNRPTHSLGHQRAIEKAIQPTGKQLTQASEDISKIDNINDLTRDFIKSMKEVAEPMRRELNLSQRAYEAIPVDDQKKVILLFRKKDKLKEALRKTVLPDFEANGLKPPTKGGGEVLLTALLKKKGTPSPQTLALKEQVDEARNAATKFLEQVKSRISKQIDKDINLDVQKGIARGRQGKEIPGSKLQQESELKDYLSEPTEQNKMADQYSAFEEDFI